MNPTALNTTPQRPSDICHPVPGEALPGRSRSGKGGGIVVLTLTKLADAEYVIGKVALGVSVYRPSGGGPVV
jgi:hypothetical protein